MTVIFQDRRRVMLAAGLVAVLVAGLAIALHHRETERTVVVAYFDNTNGVFAGDDVRIRGVTVGKIEKIEPEPQRAKVTFWVDRRYDVPADAKAVILSPQLGTARAVQLTPPYTDGPTMQTGAVIPQDRTVVPVEWDGLRIQLERLTQLLKPARPGGVSTLGALLNTAADNLRGQGPNIREAVVNMSQAVTALSDHSGDIFSTLRNLATLVSALQDSTGLLQQLNGNLADVSAPLAADSSRLGGALEDLNSVIADVQSFAADNREPLGTASDKLASISTALVQSLDDIKQTLHVAPTGLVDLANISKATSGGLSGILAVNNFANPIGFLCGAIQAASRMGAEQVAKLCAQYLAPIVKNRQYNFPPIGENILVGAQARPNELTYSEDWMRPDFVPPAGGAAPPAPESHIAVTDPAAGLTGMMVPPGGGP